ncbi:MAG: hypothetical protein JKX84_03430 [Flavobacteriales bacterium]|nr:hypothetical protein [Flavobacteriales bacterium]
MPTLTGFYTRVSETSDEKNTVISVRLNADHEVYKGHFPGKPVAPGAALTQMVLDEVSRLTKNKRVAELKQIKFLSVIDPNVVSEIELLFDFRERKGQEMFTCVGRAGDTTFFKLNGIFAIAAH